MGSIPNHVNNDPLFSRFLGGRGINCPFGTIELPIDLWYCKLAKKRCPIQAWVDPPDFVRFEEHCEANQHNKDGVKKVILSGEYRGEHHMAGRDLCAAHNSRAVNSRYFYANDLFWLGDYVDLDSTDTRVKMIRRKVSITYASGYVCKDCLDKALRKLGIEVP